MTENERVREELGFNLGTGEYNMADRKFKVVWRQPADDKENVVTILDNDGDGPAISSIGSGGMMGGDAS